jgi:hypothetical protein
MPPKRPQTSFPVGPPELWTKAKSVHKSLVKTRAREAALSAELDEVVGTLNKKHGNTGYTIARELKAERITVMRILRRVSGKKVTRAAKKAAA